LSGYFLEQSRDDPGAANREIEATSRNSGWLIFATNDVWEDPILYGWQPSFFEKVARWATSFCNGTPLVYRGGSLFRILGSFKAPSISLNAFLALADLYCLFGD
jgi:hypothetical protein